MVEERPPVETLRPTTLGLDESTFLIEERREHREGQFKRKAQEKKNAFLCVLRVLCGKSSCGIAA
jgi:hypothetical protein